MQTNKAPIIICTLVFPEKSGKILLGFGKKGVSKGKWNGFGGKVDPTDKDIQHAAARELQEETGLISKPEDLDYKGSILFHWDNDIAGIGINSVRDILVHMFSIFSWQGNLVETEAMQTPTWFAKSDIPFNLMIGGEKHWLPYLLDGKNFEGKVSYDAYGNVVWYDVRLK